MKTKDLVEVSKELNKLLFDPKEKDEGWIDTTGSNVKRMIKGIKEAAAVLESEDELTEATLDVMREIDWSLDDYDEENAALVQETLQKMGIWLNEDDDEEDDDEEKPKKKAPAKKKKPEPDDDDEDDTEEEPMKKPKKASAKKALSKEEKGSRLDTLCEVLKKKPKTLDEMAEKANDLWVAKGGTDSVKESRVMGKFAIIVLGHFLPDQKVPTK